MVIANLQEKYDFADAIKAIQALENKLVLNMVVYLQIPRLLRKYHVSIAKETVNSVIKSGSQGEDVSASEFGFENCSQDKNMYVVNRTFDDQSDTQFRLDDERLHNLTKVVNFLEEQNYNLDKAGRSKE